MISTTESLLELNAHPRRRISRKAITPHQDIIAYFRDEEFETHHTSTASQTYSTERRRHGKLAIVRHDAIQGTENPAGVAQEVQQMRDTEVARLPKYVSIVEYLSTTKTGDYPSLLCRKVLELKPRHSAPISQVIKMITITELYELGVLVN